jgi:hypothetical protein
VLRGGSCRSVEYCEQIIAVFGQNTYLSSFPSEPLSAVSCCQRIVFVREKPLVRHVQPQWHGLCMPVRKLGSEQGGNGKLLWLLTFLASAASALKYCSNASFKPVGFSSNQSFMQKFLQNCQIESHNLVATRGTCPSIPCRQRPILSCASLSLNAVCEVCCHWCLQGSGLFHTRLMLSSV